MYAVLHVPHFRLQAALRWRETAANLPLALVDGAEKKSVALEINAEAARQGVQPGMPVPQALARCPSLTVIPRSPDAEQLANNALLHVAGSLSPEIEATSSGVCTLHLRLPENHDWEALGRRAVSLMEAQNLHVRAGVAPNPDLAFLAAKRAAPVLVVLEASSFLDGLPVAALNPPAELLTLLRDWGIRTLRELRLLPRGDFMDRLGPDAGRLWELASGSASRPLRLTTPPEDFTESFDFEYEVETTGPLLFILRRFLDQLSARMRGIWRVAGSMKLVLRLEEDARHERLFTIPEPTSDPKTLFRILSTHLEPLTLTHRPVGISLHLEPVAVSRDQLQLFETALRDPNGLGETLARLAALPGIEAAGVVSRQDTHQPDQWSITPPRFHQLTDSPAVATAAPATGLPLHRLRPPQNAAVRLKRHRPEFVESPEARGPVVAALGPYRLSGQWWDSGGWAHEEWDVELESGSLLRLACFGREWVLTGYYELVSTTLI